jgi:hypothetical protein
MIHKRFTRTCRHPGGKCLFNWETWAFLTITPVSGLANSTVTGDTNFASLIGTDHLRSTEAYSNRDWKKSWEQLVDISMNQEATDAETNEYGRFAFLIILSLVGHGTWQITSRSIEYSEFIPLALTITHFTISQVLPSAVSQTLLLLEYLPCTRYSPTRRLLEFNWLVNRYSLVTHSVLTRNWLNPH